MKQLILTIRSLNINNNKNSKTNDIKLFLLKRHWLRTLPWKLHKQKRFLIYHITIRCETKLSPIQIAFCKQIHSAIYCNFKIIKKKKNQIIKNVKPQTSMHHKVVKNLNFFSKSSCQQLTKKFLNHYYVQPQRLLCKSSSKKILL